MYCQLRKPNSVPPALTKIILLALESTISTVVLGFSLTGNAYADSVPDLQPAFAPSLQQTLKQQGNRGSAKDLGSVAIPAYDPRRPCYEGEQTGCIFGNELFDADRRKELNQIADSIRVHPIQFEAQPSQLHVLQISLE